MIRFIYDLQKKSFTLDIATNNSNKTMKKYKPSNMNFKGFFMSVNENITTNKNLPTFLFTIGVNYYGTFGPIIFMKESKNS